MQGSEVRGAVSFPLFPHCFPNKNEILPRGGRLHSSAPSSETTCKGYNTNFYINIVLLDLLGIKGRFYNSIVHSCKAVQEGNVKLCSSKYKHTIIWTFFGTYCISVIVGKWLYNAIVETTWLMQFDLQRFIGCPNTLKEFLVN